MLARILPSLATVFLFVTALPAHADSFVYDFLAGHFDQPDESFSFTYTSPHLITTDESDLQPTKCSAAGGDCNSIDIWAESGFININAHSGFSVSLPSSYFEIGTHRMNDEETFVMLAIQQVSEPNPVPEPSTLALLLTGFVGVLGALKIGQKSLLSAASDSVRAALKSK